MTNLDGIDYQKQDKYSVFLVKDLTEEIKTAIRKQLSEICHGVDTVKSGFSTYNYKNTVKEFLKRYDCKPKNIQIGMIGELIVHLILKEYFKNYKSVTPYFNMEERSIKKGYDVVVTEVNNPILWIIEVKSGELHQDKNQDQTINDLIGTARDDLKERLNKENTSLWMEAINGAKLSFDANDTMKNAIIGVLGNWSDLSTDGTYSSKDKNVILTGVLFSDTGAPVTENNLKKKQSIIEKSAIFKQIHVLGIQKSTYLKVRDFLRDEAK